MNTYIPSTDKIEKKWYVVDATDKTLGRLASEVANVLRGKNKPYYTPFLDTGDYVIIVNAEKIKVSGKKMDQKIYFRHSEYVGSAKYTTLREMMRTKPVKVVEKCFPRADSVTRCTPSFMFMKDLLTSIRHRSPKN